MRAGVSGKLGLLRLLRRSLLHRAARSLSALIALTVSAAVGTTLLTLYADLETKLHHTFRDFGANIVVSLPNGGPALARLGRQAAGPGATVALFGYAVATTDRGTPVVVSGTDFAAVRQLDRWWEVTRWPKQSDEALVGQRAAQFVGGTGHFTLHYAGRAATFAEAGQLQTGGDEESRIYLPMTAFVQWTGVQPGVLEVQIPGSTAAVNAAIARLRAALPGADVEPVRQLVEGESRIVDRTHALMFAAVVLIALTVAVSVLATLSASVLERRRDFALMKALGGGAHHLRTLFLLETLVLALGGVLAGWLLGSLAAYAISVWNFDTATLASPRVVPAVLVLNLLITAIAVLLPLRSLARLQPAALLKGE